MTDEFAVGGPVRFDNSSNIAELDYIAKTRTLFATFRNGGRYVYFDVGADVWRQLLVVGDGLTAEASIGKAFNRLIRQGGFKFGRVDQAGAPEEGKPDAIPAPARAGEIPSVRAPRLTRRISERPGAADDDPGGAAH